MTFAAFPATSSYWHRFCQPAPHSSSTGSHGAQMPGADSAASRRTRHSYARCFWCRQRLSCWRSSLPASRRRARSGATRPRRSNSRIDLVIVVDISASMLSTDAQPSRLGEAQRQIDALLSRMAGDRVGLVIFAGEPFVRSPVTSDLAALQRLVDGIDGNVACFSRVRTSARRTDRESHAGTRRCPGAARSR